MANAEILHHVALDSTWICQYKRLNFSFFPLSSTWKDIRWKPSAVLFPLPPGTGRQCKSSQATDALSKSCMSTSDRVGQGATVKPEEWPSNTGEWLQLDQAIAHQYSTQATTNTCNQRELEALNSKQPEESEAVSSHWGENRRLTKQKLGALLFRTSIHLDAWYNFPSEILAYIFSILYDNYIIWKLYF